jgi:hypothetical protein
MIKFHYSRPDPFMNSEVVDVLRAIPEERIDELPQALALIFLEREKVPSLFFVPSLTRRCPLSGQEANM